MASYLSAGVLDNIPIPTSLYEAITSLDGLPYYYPGTQKSGVLQLGKLEETAQRCLDWVDCQDDEVADLVERIGRDGLAAIALYLEDFVQLAIADLLQDTEGGEASEASVQPVFPFLSLLLETLHRLPPKYKYNGTLYQVQLRNTPVSVGEHITYHGPTLFVSSTKGLGSLEGLGSGRTVVLANDAHGYAIGTLSPAPSPDVILVEPLAQFSVESIVEYNEGHPLVEIGEVQCGLRVLTTTQTMSSSLLQRSPISPPGRSTSDWKVPGQECLKDRYLVRGMLRAIPLPTSLSEALNPMIGMCVYQADEHTYVTLEAEALNEEMAASFEWIDSQEGKVKELAQRIGRDGVAAVRLWMTGSIQSFLTARLEDPHRTKASVQSVLPFLRLLLETLHQLPEQYRFRGTLYQAQNGVPVVLQHKNKKVESYAYYAPTLFSQTPTSIRNCKKLQGERTVVVLNGAQGYSVRALCDDPEEDAVAVEPLTVVQVDEYMYYGAEDLMVATTEISQGLHYVVGTLVHQSPLL